MESKHPYDTIIDLVKNMKSKAWGEAMASCPCPGHTHGDSHPSLHLSATTTKDGEDTVLLSCVTRGHTAEEVCAALGVEMSALYRKADSPKAFDALSFGRKKSTSPNECPYDGEHEAERRKRDPDVKHEYTGLEGRTMEVLRWDFPDGCKKIRAEGSTKGVWYSPCPILGPDADPRIWTAEGGKAADALALSGKHVVAWPSAGSRPSDEALRAGYDGFDRVVVFGDKGGAGESLAGHLARGLTRIGKAVELVRAEPDWKEGFDAADLLYPTVTAKDLHAAVVDGKIGMSPGVETLANLITIAWAAGPKPLAEDELALFRSVKDIFDTTPDVAWVCPGIAAYGCLTLLIAKTKVGKTQLMLGLARALLLREAFLGQPVEADIVLYLSEQGQQTLKDQLARAGLGQDTPDGLRFLRMVQVGHLDWGQRVELVERLARTELAGKRVVIVVDTLAKWAKLRKKEENDSGAMGQAMLPLQRLAQEFDFAVVALHHAPKASADEDTSPSDAGRGSSAISGDADIILHLARPPHRQAHERRIRYLTGEGRLGGLVDTLAIEWQEDGTYASLGEGEEYESDRVESGIMRALEEAPPLTEEEVMDAVGGERTTVRRALEALTSPDGPVVLERIGAGKRNAPYRYQRMKATEGVVGHAPRRAYADPLVSNGSAHDPSVDSSSEQQASLEVPPEPLVTIPPLAEVSDQSPRVQPNRSSAGSHPRGRRPPCTSDAESYRQHQFAMRRISETTDDWVCTICDEHGRDTSTVGIEAHQGASA